MAAGHGKNPSYFWAGIGYCVDAIKDTSRAPGPFRQRRRRLRHRVPALAEVRQGCIDIEGSIEPKKGGGLPTPITITVETGGVSMHMNRWHATMILLAGLTAGGVLGRQGSENIQSGRGQLGKFLRPLACTHETERSRREQPARVRLHAGDVPLGSLGRPLGSYLLVEGVRANGAKSGKKTLHVEVVNGEKLIEATDIWVENIRELPEDTRVELAGYETGAMEGPVPAAIRAAEKSKETVLLPQRGWQWHPYFVALSATKPKLTVEERNHGFKVVKPGTDSVVPREKGARLPQIKLFKVIEGKSVRMRTDNAHLVRLGADGGIMDDRLYINGATGKVELDPNTWLPDEISLTTGETCMIVSGGQEVYHFRGHGSLWPRLLDRGQ